MLIDPSVERHKFDAEVVRLRANEERLRGMGVWIARVEAPQIDLLLIPRHCARLALPTIPTTPVVPGQVDVQQIDLPQVSGRPIGLRLNLVGYDLQPPSVTFMSPWDWTPLRYDSLPLGVLNDDPKQPQLIVLDQHPVTLLPFVCLRGIREYHDHPQHDGDDWVIYRSAMNVLVLVERLARALGAAVRPAVIIQMVAQKVNGMDQVAINVQVPWVTEAMK